MQTVGAQWQMLTLTGSAAYVALVSTAGRSPIMFFAVAAGPIDDLVDRRRFLLAAQGFMLAAAGTLGALALAGLVTPWTVLALIFTLGIGQAMTAPIWQTLQLELVDPPERHQAISLGFGSTVATKMFMKTGTRPIIVIGSLISADGILWLPRIPVDGSYLTNLLVPLTLMGVGLGLLYAGVQTAANAGAPPEQAGLAAALITASFQLGSAIGLAAFTGIATSRTSHLLAARTPAPEALTAGFQRALLVSALCLVAAGAVALRAANTRGEPTATPQTQQDLEPAYDLA